MLRDLRESGAKELRHVGLAVRKQLDQAAPSGGEEAIAGLHDALAKRDVSRAVDVFDAAQLGCEIAQHEIHGTVDDRLELTGGVGREQIGNDRSNVRELQVVDGLRVDADDDTAGSHRLCRDLQPTARPATEIEHARAGCEQPKLSVELLKLERSA